MGFEGQLSDADKACKHERDEDVRDEVARYRLMFRYPTCYFEGSCVVAHFDRLDVRTGSWEQLDYGVGNDEWQAIRALRAVRYEARSLGRELKAFAARKAVRS